MAKDVEILIKAVDKASKQLDAVEKELKQIDKTSKKVQPSVKGVSSNLKGLAITAGVATGALAAIAIAGKQAFEFGQRGAEVAQTAESFDMLIAKVGATPDLLERLRDASRGTISDMSLMSSTATLLAGSSGELGTALANSTPQLMKIAKAASKLNPALGDTAFMYQSIATGVKRAQPLILDNLGLTLKVSTATEKHAKALGKTVEQLTAEEKSMAILNATLEAGDVMIDQVGGTTEAATDVFEQFTTNVQNLKDAMAEQAAPAITDVVIRLNDLLIANMEATVSQNELRDAFRHGALTSEEFTKALYELRTTGELSAETLEALHKGVTASKKAMEQGKSAIDGWAERLGEAQKSAEGVATNIGKVAISMQEITRQKEAQDLIKMLNDEFNDPDSKMSREEFLTTFGLISTTIGGLSADEAAAKKALQMLKWDFEDTGAGIEEQTRRTNDFLNELLGLPESIQIAIELSIPDLPSKLGGGSTGGGSTGGGSTGGGSTGGGSKPSPKPEDHGIPEFAGAGSFQQTNNISLGGISNDMDAEEVAFNLVERLAEYA